MTKLSRLCRTLVCVFVLSQPLCAKAGPERVASLNLCLDQMVLALIPRERIASLTYLAADPKVSVLANKVGDIALNRGLAEQLIPLKPDLILAGQFGASEAVSILRRLGYRVETLALPRTLADIRLYIHRMGRLLKAETQAESMLIDMDKHLAQVGKLIAGQEKIPALIYGPNGVTFGSDTLEHELLVLAGYENIAATLGITGYSYFPLERLVSVRPQRLVIDAYNKQNFSIAREYLYHPVLKKIIPAENYIVLPRAMSVCSAPFVSQLVEALVAQR